MGTIASPWRYDGALFPSTTFGWARSRLRISEMTFLSSRYFTDQPGANLFGAAGQKRL
jgi:hypothetical protein